MKMIQQQILTGADSTIASSEESKDGTAAPEENPYEENSSSSFEKIDPLVPHIPCLFLPHDDGASKLLLYFHGNAEDIGLAFDLLYIVGQNLKMHVMAVEYPGYGLYKSSGPDEQQIKQDAVIIYDYIVQCLGVAESDIIVFGRSMGSGPSSYLASVRRPYSLFLMSPYTSI
mmetsp:Transcript_1827/g.2455  ORF Transcript_1827/g.2455 Transcript_1827/m.2455 type:complete len:172 (+) Transcript_1827:663-1178(+)